MGSVYNVYPLRVSFLPRCPNPQILSHEDTMLDSKLEREKKVPQKHQYCHLQVVGPPTRKKVTLPPARIQSCLCTNAWLAPVCGERRMFWSPKEEEPRQLPLSECWARSSGSRPGLHPKSFRSKRDVACKVECSKPPFETGCHRDAHLTD